MDGMSNSDTLERQKWNHNVSREKGLNFNRSTPRFKICQIKMMHFKRGSPSSAALTKENRRRKKLYLEKVGNEAAFFQKENILLGEKMSKKVRYLQKLKAENVYLKSVIKNNIVVRSLLITLNNYLRSKQPLDFFEDSLRISPENLPDKSSNTNNNSEDSLIHDALIDHNLLYLYVNNLFRSSLQFKKNSVITAFKQGGCMGSDIITQLEGDY